MTLETQIPGWIQRQIEFEIGAVHFVTIKAGHLLVVAWIDDSLPYWMGYVVSPYMTAGTKIGTGTGQEVGIACCMRSMANGAVLTRVGNILVLFLLKLRRIEMAAHA